MIARNRGVVVLGIVLVAVVLTVLLFGSDSERPFDLDSTSDSGYKGLRLVLEGLGASVESIDVDELGRSSPERFTSLLVMGGSAPTDSQLQALRRVAGSGRPIVTAGPVGGLGAQTVAPDADGSGLSTIFGDEVCDIDDLRVVGPIDGASYLPLVVPDGARSCIGDGTLAAVVSQDVDAGRVVTVASAWLFTNDAMRPHDQETDDPKTPMPDNVVLAGRLLIGAEEGRPDHVGIVTGIAGGARPTGQTTLSDLLSPGVKLGLGQLLIAFGVYAWWRSRRVGRPVEEPLPVTIAGSELVAATGNFRERQGDAHAAAVVVRRETARQLAARLGLPLDAPIEHIASQVAARSGRDPDPINGALWAWPVRSDDDLVRVTSALDVIRQEVTHV